MSPFLNRPSMKVPGTVAAWPEVVTWTLPAAVHMSRRDSGATMCPACLRGSQPHSGHFVQQVVDDPTHRQAGQLGRGQPGGRTELGDLGWSGGPADPGGGPCWVLARPGRLQQPEKHGAPRPRERAGHRCAPWSRRRGTGDSRDLVSGKRWVGISSVRGPARPSGFGDSPRDA